MAAEPGVDEKSTKMQIFVVLPRPSTLMNPNTISLEVCSSDTVPSLKARLEGIDSTQYVSPIPPERQRLVLAGSALPDDDDGRTLADLGVADSSTLQLVETQMEVWVRNLCCPMSTHIMSGLSSIDTVDTIKARYEAATGMPADRQKITYQSREVRNGSRLADWGATNCSMVYVDRMPWHHTEAACALSRVLMVKVYRRTTVRRIKELVEAAEGVPVATQRASRIRGLATGYSDEDLEDGQTVEELGVMDWPRESPLNPPFMRIEYRWRPALLLPRRGRSGGHRCHASCSEVATRSTTRSLCSGCSPRERSRTRCRPCHR
jgi:hypothetical protein